MRNINATSTRLLHFCVMSFVPDAKCSGRIRPADYRAPGSETVPPGSEVTSWPGNDFTTWPGRGLTTCPGRGATTWPRNPCTTWPGRTVLEISPFRGFTSCPGMDAYALAGSEGGGGAEVAVAREAARTKSQRYEDVFIKIHGLIVGTCKKHASAVSLYGISGMTPAVILYDVTP